MASILSTSQNLTKSLNGFKDFYYTFKKIKDNEQTFEEEATEILEYIEVLFRDIPTLNFKTVLIHNSFYTITLAHFILSDLKASPYLKTFLNKNHFNWNEISEKDGDNYLRTLCDANYFNINSLEVLNQALEYLDPNIPSYFNEKKLEPFINHLALLFTEWQNYYLTKDPIEEFVKTYLRVFDKTKEINEFGSILNCWEACEIFLKLADTTQIKKAIEQHLVDVEFLPEFEKTIIKQENNTENHINKKNIKL